MGWRTRVYCCKGAGQQDEGVRSLPLALQSGGSGLTLSPFLTLFDAQICFL
jgi:hypothetical protein